MHLVCLPYNTTAVPVYGERGQLITLPGVIPNGHWELIQWEHNKTVIVEWDGEKPPEYHYGNLELDIKLFSLTVFNLQSNDSGLYRCTSDSESDTPLSYQLHVLDPLHVPSITYNCNSSSCTLNCTTGSEDHHTQYTWTDNKGRNVTGAVWTVEKTEHLDGIYTCSCSNPVSWKTKNITEKELFPESTARSHVWTVASFTLFLLMSLLLLIRACILRATAPPIDKDSLGVA